MLTRAGTDRRASSTLPSPDLAAHHLLEDGDGLELERLPAGFREFEQASAASIGVQPQVGEPGEIGQALIRRGEGVPPHRVDETQQAAQPLDLLAGDQGVREDRRRRARLLRPPGEPAR